MHPQRFRLADSGRRPGSPCIVAHRPEDALGEMDDGGDG
ncbi:hypothetical protein XA26_32330 [Mycolicibacterium fortuitum]|uniref:Uncharacterized protein n=1 Tax=Mycolicibacterium fortuitum TaxID=1766 RepID=A0A0N9YAN1_MYCFO|nr:hypothetical protein XA26_32330 [Mycolicibacterium fortuitum]